MGNILNILLKLSPALEAGKSLENANGWSNVAMCTHALVAVMGFLLLIAKQFGLDVPISDAQILTLAGAVAGVGGTVSAYLHVAANPSKGVVRK